MEGYAGTNTAAGTEGTEAMGQREESSRVTGISQAGTTELQLHISQEASGWGDSEAPRLPLPGQAQMAQA